MATTEQVPTNERIAIDLLGWRGQYDVDSQWWERAPSDMTAKRERITELPDYLNDPSTLGEAEGYCRAQDWLLAVDMWPDGEEESIGPWSCEVQRATDEVTAYGASLSAAVWTALLRASETEQEATG